MNPTQQKKKVYREVENNKEAEREMNELSNAMVRPYQYEATVDPIVIFHLLLELGEKQCKDFKVSKNYYKLRLVFEEKEEESEEVNQVRMKVEFYSKGDGKYVVDMYREQGDIY